MFVKNYVTDEYFVEMVICDVCGLPIEEEDEICSYHIHNDCFYSLELHAPGSKETLKTLGFKEYK